MSAFTERAIREVAAARSVRLICAQSKPAHDEAAQQARQEQYEDKDGLWHDEVSASDDRPETDVEG
jgi:hypothetical protein